MKLKRKLSATQEVLLGETEGYELEETSQSSIAPSITHSLPLRESGEKKKGRSYVWIAPILYLFFLEVTFWGLYILSGILGHFPWWPMPTISELSRNVPEAGLLTLGVFLAGACGSCGMIFRYLLLRRVKEEERKILMEESEGDQLFEPPKYYLYKFKAFHWTNNTALVVGMIFLSAQYIAAIFNSKDYYDVHMTNAFIVLLSGGVYIYLSTLLSWLVNFPFSSCFRFQIVLAVFVFLMQIAGAVLFGLGGISQIIDYGYFALWEHLFIFLMGSFGVSYSKELFYLVCDFSVSYKSQ